MLSAEPLVLVAGADDSYAMPLAVTLHSALSNLRDDCEPMLCIIDGGISDDHKRALERTVYAVRPGSTLRWHEPDMAALGKLWVAGHVTAAAYCRLLVHDAVPEGIGRALYLDSDLLVEDDLAQLWTAPLDGRAVLGVQDYLIPYLGWPGGPAGFGPSHRAAGRPYFNSGVLVVDLDMWRREAIPQRALHYLRKHEGELTFRDQEGLNAVLAGEVGLLDPRWNVSTSLLWLERWPESPFKERMRRSRDALLADPGIWHFTGPSKPWHRGFTHPARDRWLRQREKAGWPGSPVPGRADLVEWLEAQRLDDREIAAVIPSGASLLLVGDSCRLPVSVEGRRALPFPEAGGVYAGTPEDDASAIRELGRVRRCGTRFIVFERSAFWWLDHYRDFADHLRSTYSCVRESDRLMIFDLGA